MSETGLFNEFPEVSSKQWKQKIQFDLKGADYNEALVWESLEGIKVKPFYHSEDLNTLKTFSLDKGNSWNIAQTIYAGDAKMANTKAITVIGKGAECLIFDIPNDDIDFELLLSKLDLRNTPLHFNFQFLQEETVKRLLARVKNQQAEIHLHFDLVGNLARSGNWFHNLEKDHKMLENIIQLAAKQDNCTVLGVDLSLYQNAGANMVQQLAYTLSHANEYLNHFSDAHSNFTQKSLPITFKVAVGSNYFFEIAKIRALRWLWKSLASEYGLKDDCHILAYPSKRNKTLYDYNVNMLRTTSECMSAILGGANTICNLPYDAIYHKDNEFGERIARNQLLLLREESYFSQTSTASKGAYYIESLTQQLAEKALILFKQIEGSGGFLSEIKKGNIQRKLKDSALREQKLFDTGEIPLLGTNTFQNKQDQMKEDLELYPFVKTQKRKTIIVPIIEKRLAEELEQKRLENE